MRIRVFLTDFILVFYMVWGVGCIHGFRYGLWRSLFAWSSLVTFPFSASHVRVRPTFIAMLARIHDALEMWPCWMSATGFERLSIAARKFRQCARRAGATWVSRSFSVLSSG